jgi:UDP-3-O-[3-hydroxymyristoyl] glucosamine N-acyltransferase
VNAIVPLRAASAGERARQLGGEVDDAIRAVTIDGVSAVWEGAGPTTLVPVLRPRAVDEAVSSRAVLLVDASLAARVPPGRRWVHPHASWALSRLLAEVETEETPLPDERHLARIHPEAEIGPDVRIGAFAVIARGVVLGKGSIVEPHAVLHERTRVGERVRIGASSVIGRPGFGWVTSPAGAVERMPQLGGVILEDDVEIGPLSTVDAGTLGPTRIGRGAKLDAQVHVGHNASIGPGTLVAAQTGLAGSALVGAGCLVGGQVGIADHCRVGDGARLAAKSGVIGDVPPGATFAGYPAVARVRWLRGMARLLGRALFPETT